MPQMNWLAILVAAICPLIVGFVWYNPKVFGNAWMNATGMTSEKAREANMALVFGLTFIFSFLIAMAMNFLTIHQFSVYSILANEPEMKNPDSELMVWLKEFMGRYGSNFRTFKHGAFHGVLSGVMLALPVVGVNALFERRSFKYIAINAGYWIVSFAVMGGVVCAWQ